MFVYDNNLILMIKIMRTCHGYSLTSTGSPPAILCDLLARPHLQLASEEPASFIIIKFPHNQAVVDCFRKDAIYHNLSRNGSSLCICEKKLLSLADQKWRTRV